MKGQGIKSERETIVRFDDEGQEAEIWTASETVYRRLKKAGYQLVEDQDRHAIFKMLKSQVKFRKAGKSSRKGYPEALAKWRSEQVKSAD